MTIFKLRRQVSDAHADPVTSAIAEWMDVQSLAKPPARRFLVNFWLMKANAELSLDETLAVYAVMMRAIPATTVVRMVLQWGVTGHANGFSKGSPEKALLNFCNEQHRALSGREVLTPHLVAKTRGNLIPRIQQVIKRKGHTLQMLDPADVDLLLRACQTAIEVKRGQPWP